MRRKEKRIQKALGIELSETVRQRIRRKSVNVREYSLPRLWEKVQWGIAFRLPKWLVYFCAIRVWAYATTHKFSSVNVDSVSVSDCIREWEKR